jgi:hypothetical protein
MEGQSVQREHSAHAHRWRLTEKDVLRRRGVDHLAQPDDMLVPQLLKDRNLLPQPGAQSRSEVVSTFTRAQVLSAVKVSCSQGGARGRTCSPSGPGPTRAGRGPTTRTPRASSLPCG